MFQKRAMQLLQQRQNSNDSHLINILIDGFSNQNDSLEFETFEIPALFPIEHVQEILSEIDESLSVSYSKENNKFLISM